MFKYIFFFVLITYTFLFSCVQNKQANDLVNHVEFNIEPVDIKPKDTKILEAWSYNNTVPGMPIIGNVGETMIIEGVNKLDKTTTIHWHGLSPISYLEDGPFKPIAPGEKFRFEFKLSKPGTYWYHSHTRPVVEQVNRGLYAPFIVKAPEDDQYDGDHIIMLSDMFLGKGKAWQPGLGIGTMERIGNTIAVNGYIDGAIQSLNMQPGEIHKLRFIGSGTASYFRVKSPWSLHITHTDGQPVEKPYETQEFIIGPGERYDAELMLNEETKGQFDLEILDSISEPIHSYKVFSKIPVNIQGEKKEGRNYIFQGVQKPDYREWLDKEPDHILYLTSSMGSNATGMEQNVDMHAHMDHGASHSEAMQMNNQGGHSAHGSTQSHSSMGFKWFINGKEYPNVPPIKTKKNMPMKIRFVNNDTHPMDHPMHLHGTSFRVLSINGQPPAQGGLLDKDVINVPKNGGEVDILLKLPETGTWMLHCHILDHEDGGMMMHVEVEE